MKVPISTLHGSVLHKLCIKMYLRHHDAGTGTCALCGHPMPCPPRQHSASVIVAAGEDPRSYDAQAWRAPPRDAVSVHADKGHRSDQPAEGAALPANVTGYRLGGVGRRVNLRHYEYER